MLPTRVFNLTLDRDNAYYANGILAFNCLTFAYPVAPRPIGEAGRPGIVAPAGFANDYDPYHEMHTRTTPGY